MSSRINLHPLSADDEAALRAHHDGEGGYERCVICRLLATIDWEREEAERAKLRWAVEDTA